MEPQKIVKLLSDIRQVSRPFPGGSPDVNNANVRKKRLLRTFPGKLLLLAPFVKCPEISRRASGGAVVPLRRAALYPGAKECSGRFSYMDAIIRGEKCPEKLRHDIDDVMVCNAESVHNN